MTSLVVRGQLLFILLMWAATTWGQADDHDKRKQFICTVTNLGLHGANFPDNPLFLEQDSLGYLWFFSDVSAYRFDGSSYQTFPFPTIFNTPIDFEFLRSVVILPNGHFACHFANERDDVPTGDTLCAFNPINLQPSHPSVVPELRRGEKLIHMTKSQGGGRESVWLIDNAQSATRRVAQATPDADTLVSLYQPPPGFSTPLLFSSTQTGSFFLQLKIDDPDHCATIHCHDGQCTERKDLLNYTRGIYPLRKHQNQNLWFDANGEFLTMVYRHESKPPFDAHPFWVHRQDGPMMPDTAASAPVDWASRLNIKHGFRGSEVAYNATSEHLWVFAGNDLQIFHRNGDLLAEKVLPMPEAFTMGIHNVNFLNEREVIVISTFGLLHISIAPNPFEYLTIEHAKKTYNLGCRSMVSWTPDTVLLMTDASGIYTIENHRIRAVQGEDGQCSGMVVENHGLVFTQGQELIRMNDLKPDRSEVISASPHTMSWHIFKDDAGRWIVGHEGLSIVDSGRVTKHFNDRIQNAYHIVPWNGLQIVAGNSGLWALQGDSLWQMADRFPELGIISKPCHAVLVSSAGEVWICTKGDGLICWKPEDQTTTRYGVEQGLPSEVLYGVVEDDDGFIWASSNQGLIRVSPSSDGVDVFGSKHGLVETEFNRTSFLKHTDGRICFGAIAGLVSIDPRDKAFSPTATPVNFIVDRILQHNQSERAVRDITQSFRKEPHVHLGPYDDFLSIRPRVLDPSGTDYKYAYRVHSEGIEEAGAWILLDEAQIHLSNLPPGTWELQIRARGLESAWLPQILSIPITVSIPFYFQGGYQVVGVLLAFGLIFLINALRNRNLKRRNELLEARIAQRTVKLEQTVALKDAYLSETHHRVKNNLQIISSLLDLQAAQVKDDGIREQFNISKTRIDSIALIHQRLYSKPDIQSIDFKSFLIEMVRLIERSQLNASDQIALSILGDDLHIRHRDGVPLGMIFNELFTNTIKHVVPLGQNTAVDIVIEKFPDGRVQLAYDDHGPGLPSSIVFEKMESLGLRLVGRFIHQLGGTAIVDPASRSRVLIEFVQH